MTCGEPWRERAHSAQHGKQTCEFTGPWNTKAIGIVDPSLRGLREESPATPSQGTVGSLRPLHDTARSKHFVNDLLRDILAELNVELNRVLSWEWRRVGATASTITPLWAPSAAHRRSRWCSPAGSPQGDGHDDCHHDEVRSAGQHHDERSGVATHEQASRAVTRRQFCTIM